MLHGISASCSSSEKDFFDDVCKKYGVTRDKAIRLLIRKAIRDKELPLEFDYENIENLNKYLIDPCNKDHIFPIEKFIEYVENGNICQKDGIGFMSDGVYEFYEVICNASWLMEQPKNFKYVVWHNV